MEKVSVIIPCYNGEKFIDRSIKSIYIQEYTEIELIVVDDGSTDSSKEKILAWKVPFEEKGYLLKYVYQENGGPASAMNTGLKHVTGDYLSTLDADDVYSVEAIEERVIFLKNHTDIDVVRTNGWMVKNDTKRLFVTDDAEKQLDDVFTALLKGDTNNWAGSYMVRSKALFDFYSDREIYKSRYGQNLQLLLPFVYKKTCGFIDKPHISYILQDNSLTQTSNIDVAKDKSIKNAFGFRDIRIHLLEQIVKDPAEKNRYLSVIENGYWKSMMFIASTYQDKSLMKHAFESKEKYEKASLNEKIMCYSLISPAKAFIYKVIRKIKSFF